jgi:tetratricopeptide (TPR) repeat protein
VLAAGLILLALVGGIAGTTAGLVRALVAEETARTEATAKGEALVLVTKESEAKDAALQAEIAARAKETEQRKQAEALAATLESLFRGYKPWDQYAFNTITEVLPNQVRAAAERLDRDFSGDSLVRARLQNALGQALLATGPKDWAAAEPLFRAAAEVRQKQLGPDHPDTLDSRNNLAAAVMLAGRTDEAIRELEDIRGRRSRVLAPDHPDTLLTMDGLAAAYTRARRYTDAVREGEFAYKSRVAAPGPDDIATIVSACALGQAYLNAARPEDAIRLIRGIVDRWEERRPTNRSSHMQVMVFLQRVTNEELYRAVQTSEAGVIIPLSELCHRLAKSVYGQDHINTHSAAFRLGQRYSATGRLNEAIQILERTVNDGERLSRFTSTSKPSDRVFAGGIDWVNGLRELAIAYRRTGRYIEAHSTYKKFHDHFLSTYNTLDHPFWLYETREHATMLEEAGRYAMAAEVWGQYLRVLSFKLPKDAPALADTLAAIGRCHLRDGQPVGAEPVLRECLATRERAAPADWTTANTRSMLGDALLGQKKYADAESLLRLGYDALKKLEAKIPPTVRNERLREAADRLARLYEAIGYPEESAKWRAEAAGYPELAPPPRPAR